MLLSDFSVFPTETVGAGGGGRYPQIVMFAVTVQLHHEAKQPDPGITWQASGAPREQQMRRARESEIPEGTC